jgi:hypothetical protein
MDSLIAGKAGNLPSAGNMIANFGAHELPRSAVKNLRLSVFICGSKSKAIQIALQ